MQSFAYVWIFDSLYHVSNFEFSEWPINQGNRLSEGKCLCLTESVIDRSGD